MITSSAILHSSDGSVPRRKITVTAVTERDVELLMNEFANRLDATESASIIVDEPGLPLGTVELSVIN